jgi:hypothetical protein
MWQLSRAGFHFSYGCAVHAGGTACGARRRIAPTSGWTGGFSARQKGSGGCVTTSSTQIKNSFVFDLMRIRASPPHCKTVGISITRLHV